MWVFIVVGFCLFVCLLLSMDKPLTACCHGCSSSCSNGLIAGVVGRCLGCGSTGQWIICVGRSRSRGSHTDRGGCWCGDTIIIGWNIIMWLTLVKRYSAQSCAPFGTTTWFATWCWWSSTMFFTPESQYGPCFRVSFYYLFFVFNIWFIYWILSNLPNLSFYIYYI